METLIIGDNPELNGKIRDLLLQQGLACPQTNLVPLSGAAERVARAHAGLLVVSLSPNPESALEALQLVRTLSTNSLLVVGPGDDSKVILRAMREGADGYVAETDLSAGLLAMLERVRSKEATRSANGKVIAVLGPSGGSGSSTLAVNLATVLAGKGRACALIDLKLETGDLATLLDLKPDHTLADFCQNIARMDSVMFDKLLAAHPSGVHLLAAPRSFADIARITPGGISQAVAMARSKFPYVVIDMDHSFRSEQLEVLRLADPIVLVLRLDYTSLRHARRTVDYLESLGLSSDRLQVVVNRYGQAQELDAATVEETLAMKISHYIPDEPKTVNRANNKGIPVVLDKPSARVSRSLHEWGFSLNGKPRE